MKSIKNGNRTVSAASQAQARLDSQTDAFAASVNSNQQALVADLKSSFDFIVCGSGSSGSVVARRLAENENASVLLIEIGGSDDLAEIADAAKWPLNLGTDRSWNYRTLPNPYLNGRTMPVDAGKVLGGGSSINVMCWARGHKSDWDFFASEAADNAWDYASVLEIYRRIEDWHGIEDKSFRGIGGPVHVEPAADPNPIAPAMLEAAGAFGIPTFANQNGKMMEGDGGAAICDLLVEDGKRRSIFRSYVYPYMDRSNLTVLTHALVTRLTFSGKTATGVEVVHKGNTIHISANEEIILSLGAIQTPKLLMQSGIGDQIELQRFGIPVIKHLPGVGRNYQDHVACDVVWEYRHALPPRNTMCESTFFTRSSIELEFPDIQAIQVEVPLASIENAQKYDLPAAGWGFFGGVVRPQSRGSLHLSGPSYSDPVHIDANSLSHPDDMRAAIACVELCRAIGNSAALRPFTKREIMPTSLKGGDLEDFVRNASRTYYHQSSTAKMGTDSMSVVDHQLCVYGIKNLRIADSSIMPRVTTGNTMAPCVIIGERAGEILKSKYKL